MKIALIYPPTSLEERYGKAISKIAGNLPPLGMLYLASVLKQKNYEVIVLDGALRSVDNIFSKLKEFKPDVIGISCMTFIWYKTIKLIENIKKTFPDKFIILGGVHASIYKKKCLEETPYIDILVYGEGEKTIIELLEKIGNKEKYSQIKGIIYRDNNEIKENAPRELIENLDELLLPARELIDIKEYTPAFSQYKVKPVTNILTTRGCPHRCLFCTPDVLGAKIRLRSAENILKEIEILKYEYGIKDVDIWDDNFTVNRNRLVRYCELLIEKKMKIVWSSQSRVDAIDDDIARLMAKSGCWKLHFGVESMVQKNLDTLRKGIKVEQISKALKSAKKYGIEVEASFIFGIPGETYEDGIETITKMKKLYIDYARFFYLTPVGGELEKNIGKYGKLLSMDKSEYQYHKPVFVPFSMTAIELEKLVLMAYRSFYFNIGYVLKRLLKMTQPRQIMINFIGFTVLLSMISKLFKINNKNEIVNFTLK